MASETADASEHPAQLQGTMWLAMLVPRGSCGWVGRETRTTGIKVGAYSSEGLCWAYQALSSPQDTSKEVLLVFTQLGNSFEGLRDLLNVTGGPAECRFLRREPGLESGPAIFLTDPYFLPEQFGWTNDSPSRTEHSFPTFTLTGLSSKVWSSPKKDPCWTWSETNNSERASRVLWNPRESLTQKKKKKHTRRKRGTKRSQNILMECKLDKPPRFVSSILTSAPMILGLWHWSEKETIQWQNSGSQREVNNFVYSN